ncbi:MAG: SDR family oxidoreductase [Pirellulaceae bacterium]|nr:SDR family oxidoreductase [Pirellulaceae bacterium]
MNHDQAPVAVVTGAASGIGRAIALKLAADGFSIFAHTGRNLRGLQETCSDARDFGVQVRAATADYRHANSLRQFVDCAFNWQGRVDAWINNAGADVLTGTLRDRPFADRLTELWQVDVLGTMVISRAVAQRWRAGADAHQGTSRPVLINTGWDQAPHGMEGDSGQLFCTVKSAVMAFSKSFAQTLGPVARVNCIAPGWIRTAWGEGTSDYWDHRARSEALLARWGEPEDVAEAVAWLVSPAAAFINGQVVEVNGGWRRCSHG